MKVISSRKRAATIEFSRGELETLNNALNEVCNALGLEDFSTRMGTSRDQAVMLLDDIHALINQMNPRRGDGYSPSRGGGPVDPS